MARKKRPTAPKKKRQVNRLHKKRILKKKKMTGRWKKGSKKR